MEPLVGTLADGSPGRHRAAAGHLFTGIDVTPWRTQSAPPAVDLLSDTKGAGLRCLRGPGMPVGVRLILPGDAVPKARADPEGRPE